jgi:hypothetical protein
MLARARLLPVGLIASAAALFSAAPAHASGGLLASASNCSTETLSQTFLPWGDPAQYTLAPGGDFAAGAPSWSLSGGASVVAGGDGYSLNGAAPSSNSLSLPDGSSATSPAMCVGIQNPDIRYFAINTGNPSDALQVSVSYETASGDVLTTPIGEITAGGTWQPTVQDPILVNLLALLPGNETPVAFTFTPQGSGGDWQIDDVYVDPMGTGG